MPEHRIAGYAGSEPEVLPAAQPAAEPARPPATTTTTVARLVVEGRSVYVEIDGRRVPLAAEDVARLRGGGAMPTAGVSTPSELVTAIESSRAHREMLLGLPNVVSVRAGYKFVGGRIRRTAAVVVAVDRKIDRLPEADVVPPVLPDGLPTDVTVADPLDRLEVVDARTATLVRQPLLIDQVQTDRVEAEVLEAVPIITYEPPAGVSLDPVTGPMVITCHVSPDAGWAVLQPFLEETRRSMTLGMYDFTAPHIYRAIRSLLRDSDVEWRQTLDPGEALPMADDADSPKAEDKPEASINRGLSRVAGERFETAFARTGAGRTFASAYHIKVAVRDDEAIWLSSGNWQSSNQPPVNFLDPTADSKLMTLYNREWHAVVESPALADTFQRYLRGDFETASNAPEAALEAAVVAGPDLLLPVDELLEAERAAVDLQVFRPERFVFSEQDPLTVQPILTPDNYLDIVLDLLRKRPAKKLYFQNQSLNPVLSPTPRWAELLRLLAEYSNDDSLDVRIIFRNIGPIRKKLESLQAAGFNMERVRSQSGCHTKGIVIDSATVLLGSHNWTNQGVEANRDATLLIKNAQIATYYERVFVHDWERIAKPTIREEATPVPLLGGMETASVEAAGAAAALLVPWSAWLEE
jgi:hypothetical protein